MDAPDIPHTRTSGGLHERFVSRVHANSCVHRRALCITAHVDPYVATAANCQKEVAAPLQFLQHFLLCAGCGLGEGRDAPVLSEKLPGAMSDRKTHMFRTTVFQDVVARLDLVARCGT